MARQLIRAAAAQSASFAYCARHCRCKSGFVSPTTATATVVTMTIKSSVLKPVVLALLALCVLQAVQASVAATTDAGAMMDTGSSHRRDLKQAIACSEGVKATAREVCGIDTSGSTDYFICIAGKAAVACRSQAQGTFGNDCTGSCVIQ